MIIKGGGCQMITLEHRGEGVSGVGQNMITRYLNSPLSLYNKLKIKKQLYITTPISPSVYYCFHVFWHILSIILKETLAGICHTWYWVLSFIAVKMFHMLFINFGLVIIFIIISIICLGSAVFTFFCVPETRIKPENRDFNL